jgi:hypothetical protein
MEALARTAGFESPTQGTGYLAKWVAARKPLAAAEAPAPPRPRRSRAKVSRPNSPD